MMLLSWVCSPRCALLANIQGTDLYRDRKDYTHVCLRCHLLECFMPMKSRLFSPLTVVSLPPRYMNQRE